MYLCVFWYMLCSDDKARWTVVLIFYQTHKHFVKKSKQKILSQNHAFIVHKSGQRREKAIVCKLLLVYAIHVWKPLYVASVASI